MIYKIVQGTSNCSYYCAINLCCNHAALKWVDSRYYESSPFHRIAVYVAGHVHGTDEKSRIIRRTLMRYINLTSLLTFQNISMVVKKRFPTIDHLVEAGSF